MYPTKTRTQEIRHKLAILGDDTRSLLSQVDTNQKEATALTVELNNLTTKEDK